MEKRYYWLRLKKDFFTDKRIKKLRKIAGGDTYTIIYLKMQLLSLQDEGILYYDGLEETFEEEIALQIDEELEDTKITIGFLLSSGLMIKLDDKSYELVETKKCIGSETPNAEKMRSLRAKRDEEKQKSVTLLQDVTKCDIEIDIDKEIDINKKENIKRKKYGNFGWVLLTDDEYKRLVDEFGEEFIKYQISRLDENLEITKNKYKYKNFNLVLRKAIREGWYKDKVLPEWFNKEQDSKATETEINEMEEILNGLEQ